MKKLLVIILLFPMWSTAQINSDKFKAGIQAGYNISNFRTSGDETYAPDYGSKGGINVNAYIKMKCSDVIGFSIEPGIVSKGAEDIKMQYITMPLLVNISLGKYISIGLGAEASYLIKATSDFMGTELDYIDTYKRTDISALAGIDISPVNFLDIAIRYSYGLTPFYTVTFSDNTGNSSGSTKMFNKNLQLSLRYNIVRLNP